MNDAVYELMLRSDSFVLSEAENITWHNARMQRPRSSFIPRESIYIVMYITTAPRGSGNYMDPIHIEYIHASIYL